MLYMSLKPKNCFWELLCPYWSVISSFFRTYKEGCDVHCTCMKIFQVMFSEDTIWPASVRLFVVLSSWKNVKEKELNFDLLSLTLVFWMILLELLICSESYQSSLRSTPIPNHSPPSFCFLLQAGFFLNKGKLHFRVQEGEEFWSGDDNVLIGFAWFTQPLSSRNLLSVDWFACTLRSGLQKAH